MMRGRRSDAAAMVPTVSAFSTADVGSPRCERRYRHLRYIVASQKILPSRGGFYMRRDEGTIMIRRCRRREAQDARAAIGDVDLAMPRRAAHGRRRK